MKNYDLRFPIIVMLLIGVGLVTISSQAHSPKVPHGVFSKQLLGVFLSTLPLGVMWWAGRERIYRCAPFLYAGGLLLQLLTFLFGKSINGQQDWLVLGPLQFQPLELLKFSLILYLPALMAGGYQSVRSYMKPVLFFLPAYGLVVTEDLGGSFVLAVMFIVMLIIWKVPKWHVLTAAVVVAVLFPTVVFPHLKPYQQSRLTIFINPNQDARGQGYQVIQSTIAIGSGGMMGKGYKHGTQSRNGFVPEAHTDFVFASWSEEQGFVGAMGVLVLYGFLFWGLAEMASASPRLQDQIVLGGILGQIGFQALENIGASLSMLPLTGITLILQGVSGGSVWSGPVFFKSSG